MDFETMEIIEDYLDNHVDVYFHAYVLKDLTKVFTDVSEIFKIPLEDSKTAVVEILDKWRVV